MPRDALRLSQQNSKKKIHEYLETIRLALNEPMNQVDMYSIVGELSDMAERHPLNTEILRFRGSLFAKMSENERAIADFSTVIAIDEDDTQAYLGRSACYAKVGLFENAVSDLDQAVSISPHDPAVHIARARIMKVQTDYLTTAVDDVSRAVKLCTSSETSNQLTMDALILKCQLERESGFIEESLQTLKIAEAIDSMNPIIYVEMTLSQLQMAQTPRSALDAISYAISLDPASFESRIIKSRVEVSLSELPAAIETLSKTLQLFPENLQVLIFRGHIKHRLGDIGGALSDFEEAALKKSDSSMLMHNIGFCKEGLGDWNGALTYFTLAVEKNPLFSPSWFHLAKLQRIIGDPYGSLESLTRCQNDSQEWRVEQASNLFFLGRFGEAIKAIGSMECVDSTKVLLADCLFYFGKIHDAFHLYNSLSCPSPYVKFMLATCAIMLGELTYAIERLAECEGPYLAAALQARARLNFDAGRYLDAISDVDGLATVIELESSEISLRGLSKYMLHRHEDALADWITANNQDFKIQCLMAECYIKTQNEPIAFVILNNLIEQRDRTDQYKDLLVDNFLNRASIYFSQSKFEEAMNDIVTSMSMISESTPRETLKRMYALKGATNHKLGRYSIAGADLETVVEFTA